MDERERKRDQLIDRILLGVAGAATSVIAAGAAILVASPEADPQFSGAEHLAIFARPSRGLPQATARAALDYGVDPMPVGGVGPAPPLRRGAENAAAPNGPLARWRVHDVVGSDVYLIGPSGLVAAQVGADLGEAGIIERIVVERAGYAVVTSKGRIVTPR